MAMGLHSFKVISSRSKPIIRNFRILKRIEKKIEKSSIKPITSFDREDMN